MKKFIRDGYDVLFIFFIIVAIFGLFGAAYYKENIVENSLILMQSRGVLITDYLEIAGVGATFLNVSLSGCSLVLLCKRLQLYPNGSILMAILTCTGFSFFGKNIVNMWPFMLGVYIYAKIQKEDFKQFILVALLSTTLAPVINEVLHLSLFPVWILNFVLAITVGVAIGFVMVPIASASVRAHSGYNLYNVGFAAGILSIGIMGILRAFSLEIGNDFNFWSEQYNQFMMLFSMVVATYFLIIGLVLDNKTSENLKKIVKNSGRLVTDFYVLYKESTYVNMGLVGWFAIGMLFLVQGDFNGPTVGAILTIIGFGAMGKHLVNIAPIMIGAAIVGSLSNYGLESHGVILAILFSSALAPISGRFGVFWGLIAGMAHIFVATNVGIVHGGINLYNNGFAAGFVAMILVPIINTFTKEV